MCGRLVNLDTVARVLAEYYHIKTDTQLAALNEALSRVPTETVGDSHKKDHVADPGKMVGDLISRQAALNIAHKLTIPGEEFHQNNQAIGNYMAELVKLPSAQPSATDTNVGGNLIDRQAAISICDNAIDLWNGQLGTGALIAVRDAIKELPSAQRWIPCSERLPEAEYPVIVTWKNDDPKSYYQYILGKHYAGVAHYKNGTWYWYSSVTEDVLMEYGRCDSEEFDEAIKVLAWMPLPEPWKGDTP